MKAKPSAFPLGGRWPRRGRMRGQSKEQTSLEEPQKNPVGRGLAPAALCCRVSPCGASYFAHGGKVTKTPPGTAQDERSALKFAFPRPLYEGYPLNQAKNFRRAKSEWLFAFPSAPLGAGLAENFKWCDFISAPGVAEQTRLVQNMDTSSAPFGGTFP